MPGPIRINGVLLSKHIGVDEMEEEEEIAVLIQLVILLVELGVSDDASATEKAPFFTHNTTCSPTTS